MQNNKLEIRYLSEDEITPYSRNSRTHSVDQIEKLKRSIVEFGMNTPIGIRNGVIVYGHARFEALKQLGYKEFLTVDLSHLNEEQTKAYVIGDNRLSLDAGWDAEMLELEMQDLYSSGFDIELTGFSMDELLAMDIDLDLGDDESEGGEYEGSGSGDEKYTHKIESPIYEIKGELPDINDLYNPAKTNELTEEILKADIPKDVKDFLIAASNRHTVFNYEKIAEFYAHQNPEIQKLMEKSALVIIDFNQAIENGFVTLSKNIEEILQNTQDEQ